MLCYWHQRMFVRACYESDFEFESVRIPSMSICRTPAAAPRRHMMELHRVLLSVLCCAPPAECVLQTICSISTGCGSDLANVASVDAKNAPSCTTQVSADTTVAAEGVCEPLCVCASATPALMHAVDILTWA